MTWAPWPGSKIVSEVHLGKGAINGRAIPWFEFLMDRDDENGWEGDGEISGRDGTKAFDKCLEGM